MIYKGTNLVKAIYKGDQFILAVYKGNIQIYPQVAGFDHVGSYTAFNVNNISSYSGRLYASPSNWYYPLMADAMPDKKIGSGNDYLQYNFTGYPTSFYKSTAFNCRIHRCFRIYTPFATTLAVGHTRAQNWNFGSGSSTSYVNASLSMGYNYVSQVVDYSTVSPYFYLFPLAFGSWSSNWIVDHISVQVVPI